MRVDFRQFLHTRPARDHQGSDESSNGGDGWFMRCSTRTRHLTPSAASGGAVESPEGKAECGASSSSRVVRSPLFRELKEPHSRQTPPQNTNKSKQTSKIYKGGN